MANRRSRTTIATRPCGSVSKSRSRPCSSTGVAPAWTRCSLHAARRRDNGSQARRAETATAPSISARSTGARRVHARAPPVRTRARRTSGTRTPGQSRAGRSGRTVPAAYAAAIRSDPCPDGQARGIPLDGTRTVRSSRLSRRGADVSARGAQEQATTTRSIEKRQTRQSAGLPQQPCQPRLPRAFPGFRSHALGGGAQRPLGRGLDTGQRAGRQRAPRRGEHLVVETTQSILESLRVEGAAFDLPAQPVQLRGDARQAPDKEVVARPGSG